MIKNNNISARNSLLVLFAILVAMPILAGRNSSKKVSESDRRKAEYIFYEAERQSSAGNYDAAHDLIRYAHSIDPYNTSISYYLGFWMLRPKVRTKAQTEKAFELMSEHVHKHPGDLYEANYYGSACMMFGKQDEGIKTIDTLSKLHPNRIEIKMNLANSQAYAGRFADALATFDSIDHLQGPSMSTLQPKVAIYAQLKDTTSALRDAHALLAKAPHNASNNVTMSEVMQQFGYNDSALVYLDSAQKYEPDNGFVYFARANYYHTMNDSANYDKEIQKALTNENLELDDKLSVLTAYLRQRLQEGDSTSRTDELFRTLIELHPHESTIHELYSEYLIAREDYKGAAEQQGYVTDMDPTNSEKWHRLMIINMMGENFPAAVNAAEHAMAINPDSLQLLKYVAPAYYQMKEYDKAIAIYEHALTLVDTTTDIEEYSDLLGGMGDVYAAKNDTVTAITYYEKSLQAFPANDGILNNYAYYLAQCGKQLDKAERMSALAVKAQPQSATFLDTYAWVFYKKGNYSMALMYIKAAIDNDNTQSSDVLDHYGDILYMSGEHDKALEQWQKALELDPKSEQLQKKVKNKSL